VTKENGYQKRDREIARLRQVIESHVLELWRIIEGAPAWPTIPRADIVGWVEKLQHALKGGDRK
jgi:hypothetical protein